MARGSIHKETNMPKFTPDYDEDIEKWVVTERDETNMPVNQHGEYETRAKASRSAANRNYALKTTRPVVRRQTCQDHTPH